MIELLLPNRVRRSYQGGERIDRFTGQSARALDDMALPEDWTAATLTAFQGGNELPGEGLGRIADGRLVREIVGGELPILVKLLDAKERLVIQAHPTAAYARAHLNSAFGKTECWYFLDCGKNACVYLGFQQGVTREAWEGAFAAQDSKAMLGMLHRVPVRAGDFVFVAGGTPHAIGADCFMIELQEPSDLMVVTEKATPSGRVLPEKKLHMGLGFSRMFDVFDYTGYDEASLKRRFCPAPRCLPGGALEIAGPDLTDQFTLLLLRNGAQARVTRRFSIAVVTAGAGSLCGRPVQKGDRLLLDESLVTARGNADFAAALCF